MKRAFLYRDQGVFALFASSSQHQRKQRIAEFRSSTISSNTPLYLPIQIAVGFFQPMGLGVLLLPCFLSADSRTDEELKPGRKANFGAK